MSGTTVIVRPRAVGTVIVSPAGQPVVRLTLRRQTVQVSTRGLRGPVGPAWRFGPPIPVTGSVPLGAAHENRLLWWQSGGAAVLPADLPEGFQAAFLRDTTEPVLVEAGPGAALKLVTPDPMPTPVSICTVVHLGAGLWLVV